MVQRYSTIFSMLGGAAAALVLLFVVGLLAGGTGFSAPPRATYVVLPTETPTPLPIVTPTPTPGPQGDEPASIAPFGDG